MRRTFEGRIVTRPQRETAERGLACSSTKGRNGGEPMAREQRQHQAQRYTDLVTRTWEDTAFKQRLLGNPRAVLQEHGLSVANSQAVQVLEDTADTMYLVLPTKPSGHFSDEELARLAGQQPEPTRKIGQVLINAWRD